ncbi:hexose kinase [Rhodobacteraceae bacterium 2CG4]|uniref:Phosphofructokinase n=1 Tax=Halovulum marinum TaxID=2662447 RepID=A0A6L5YWQ6_9RHOB|nr:hexose kinase [Halovulum marinum]MSU88751.1 hexose kinase [Halovulum marinum]
MSTIVTVTLNPALDISTAVDAVVPDEKLRCDPPALDPGGGGVNVSRAIARLGGRSRMLVALGGGAGAEMRALLRAEGLEPEDLGVGLPTRQSIAVTDRASGQQYRFVLPGPAWQTADWGQAEAKIAAAAGDGDILVASGSQPPGVPADFWLRVNAALAPRGVRTILDTSGPALRAAEAASATPLAVLRMDRAEARALAGRPLDGPAQIAEVARALVARGAAQTAAVACGAEGNVIADAGGSHLCRAPKVAVVSKVGAGDSFVAAFALALAQGESALEAGARGTAAAASAVTTPATQLCDPALAAALRAQVEIVPL